METATTDEQCLDGWALLFPCIQEKPLISSYVEGRRRMPDDSPFPGPYHVATTPYAKEIMDAMGPYSVIQHGVMMCGAQIAKTTIMENICGYYMDELPSPILVAIGTEAGAEKWATTRLEPLIDSLGIREKIGPTYNAAKSKKTGDKTFEKLFLGGNLHIVSAQSPADLASMSKRILLRDEIDRAPQNLRSGEGNWLTVSEARTRAWRYRKKIFDSSTPGDFDISEINRLYELGDCRRYFVPCPRCTVEQILEMGDGKTFGLQQIETERGKEVVYICAHCHAPIFEYEKERMLANGKWKPTKQSSSPFMASWHLSSLYSPLKMYSWREVWDHWLEAQSDSDHMKTFVNLDLGLPYKDEGSRPDLGIVLSHQGTYRIGEIQPGVIYATIGVDVQRGKENPDNPDEGPRLEMEVLGHGEDYRTWSVLYKKFYGPVFDPHGGAWDQFWQWCAKEDPKIHKAANLAFERNDGVLVPIRYIFIDSGNDSDIVYNFCQREPRYLIPIKGIGWITDEKKKEKGDVASVSNVRHYQEGRTGGGQPLISISTNYYKGELYNRLKIQRRQIVIQSPAFCDFPLEHHEIIEVETPAGKKPYTIALYDREYFEQLRGEEKRKKDGSFHTVRTRVEALDCRVYAMAAGEAYLMTQLKIIREAAVRDHFPQTDINAMTPKWLLSLWSMQLNAQRRKP